MAKSIRDQHQHEQNILLKEIAAPGTPASGYGSLYTKTDSELYFKDDAGTEHGLISSPRLVHFDYTSLSTNFTAADNTTEQEVGLDLTIPAGLGTSCTVEVLFNWSYNVSGSTNFFVRYGTSTTSSSNAQIVKTFQSGGRRVPAAFLSGVETNQDLTSTHYLNAAMKLSSTGYANRLLECWVQACSLTVRVYK